MTDLGAIRARHVKTPLVSEHDLYWCYIEDEEWPCEMAQVLAALDAASITLGEYVRVEAKLRLRAALATTPASAPKEPTAEGEHEAAHHAVTGE